MSLALTLLGCTPSSSPRQEVTAVGPNNRRAIVVSFDALNEQRMRQTIDPSAVPNFLALFDEGACADGARPAFPSVTSPGHASLWTGAYGNINGVAANSQPVLPQTEHTLLESISGYSAAALRAEPIWITAAASGLTAYGHHVTQAPEAPGYPSVRGDDPVMDSLRAYSAAVLAKGGAQVINGYNRQLSPDIALTEKEAPPRAAAGWKGLDALRSGVPPLEIAWAAGADSIHGLLYGADRYDRILISLVRDASAGATAVAEPVERAPYAGRELARFFSSPLELRVEGGRAFIRARLFEVAPDGSSFLLFLPELRVVEGSRPGVSDAYDTAIRGWYGNAAINLTERGKLGPTLWQGGDGTAELRYLESAELVTRQFERGADWVWNAVRPSLMLDYFPLIDEVDHMLFGHVVPSSPRYDAAIAARVQEMRARAWALADGRLGRLRALVDGDSSAALFVGGDHGMRATWRVFRPNAALASAGLLAVDSAGRVDLSRTRALSPNGYWVMANSTDWRGGIVSHADQAAVVDEAERALRAVRGADGQPVVTRIWRAAEHDTLGMGGPVGGQLYYEVAEGYYWTADPRGPVTGDGRVGGGHGYPSVAADMQTVLCATGTGMPHRRIAPARTVDMSPTVAEWLGIRPPANAVGRSLLGSLMAR